ncbi:MAG: hypothetical protein AAGA88_06885 [Pseudomonadota bacterium]
MAANIIAFVELYGQIGAVVAVVFLLFGIDRVSPGANGALTFRVMIAPGLALLWPLVLIRWWVLERAK